MKGSGRCRFSRSPGALWPAKQYPPLSGFLAALPLPIMIEYCPQRAGLWGLSQIAESPDS